MQNNTLCMVHTKKYEIYNNIVRCTDFPQENKMHTSKHHHIYFRKPLLKIRCHSPETSKVNNAPFWQQSHFMQTIRLYVVVGTHIKGQKHTNIVRCIDFSQQTNMHTSQHQYIHCRKPSLKIGLHSPEAPRVCKQHYTCGNPVKWKVRGQPANTDHRWY